MRNDDIIRDIMRDTEETGGHKSSSYNPLTQDLDLLQEGSVDPDDSKEIMLNET